MFDSQARRRLEERLGALLPAGTRVKSSLLLQAYATFSAIKNEQSATMEEAYEAALVRYDSCKIALVKNFLRPFPDAFEAVMREFLAYDPEDFLRFVVPDLVCNAEEFWQEFCERQVCDVVKMVCCIIQIRLALFKESDVNKVETGSDVDDWETALRKLYGVFCDLTSEDEQQISYADFVVFYQGIVLYQLDEKEYSAKVVKSGKKEFLKAIEILTCNLQFPRAQLIEYLHRIFIRKEQADKIAAGLEMYRFMTEKETSERQKLMRKAMLTLLKSSPLECLCEVSIRKIMGYAQGRSHAEIPVIKNDVTIENGLVYTAFTAQFSPCESSSSQAVVVFPSPFFVRKWMRDPIMRKQRAVFVLRDQLVCDLIDFHYRNGRDGTNPGQLITFSSLEKWKESPKINSNIATKALLFTREMTGEERNETYRILKNETKSSAEIFEFASANEFERAKLPLKNILNDPDFSLLDIDLIPQGINNSAEPRRKLLLHGRYEQQQMAGEKTTKICAYTLNTEMGVQALARMQEAPVEVCQKEFCKLEGSVKALFNEELLKRRGSGPKRSAAFSFAFTPDIWIWCSKTYPENNVGRPRLEAYVRMPERESEGKRGAIIKETKKTAIRIATDRIFAWLEEDYPYSKVFPRRSRKEMAEGVSAGLTVPTDIRDEIISRYTAELAGENIALKTLWYLYPNLQHRYSQQDYLLLGDMMRTEIGAVRVANCTMERCEGLLPIVYPEETQETLWRRVVILSKALQQAVDEGYCAKNLLLEVVEDQRRKNKAFAQVRRALTKKHFTPEELKAVLAVVCRRLEEGRPEYIGVLIRLLTGLDANVVCALKWKDLRAVESYGFSQLVVTRQTTNDGSEVRGFSSLEDYLCFPCSPLLDGYLQTQFKKLKKLLPRVTEANLQELPMVNTAEAFLDAKGRHQFFAPQELRRLCKETVKEIGIAERVVELALDKGGIKETNLNSYMGDLFRENFKHWAASAAKASADETCYLTGNKPETTFGTFYCDYLNEASQYVLFMKLRRLDAMFAAEGSRTSKCYEIGTTDKVTHTFEAPETVPLRVDIHFGAKGQGRFKVKVESEYGHTSYVALEEVEKL